MILLLLLAVAIAAEEHATTTDSGANRLATGAQTPEQRLAA